MFCVQCGSKLEDGALFCSVCGTKVEGVTECKCDEAVSENVESVGAVSQEEHIKEQVDELKSEALEPIAEIDEEIADSAKDTVGDEVNCEETQNGDDVCEIVIEQNDSATKESPQPKRKKKTSVVGHVFASLLSIFLALFLVVTLVVASVAIVFSSGTISGIINELDLTEIEIDDIVSKSELKNNGLKCESDNLFDIIYDNIDQSKMADPLTKSEYRKIVESDEFNDYFGKLLDERIDSIMSGKETQLVESDDVLDFLREEKRAIKKIIGYEITDERIDNLAKNLDKNFDKAFESLVFDIGSGAGVKLVGVIFSGWLLPILILIDLLLCTLIFIIVRSARVGLNYCGVTTLVISSIFAVAVLGLYLLVDYIVDLVFLADVMPVVLLPVLILSVSVFAASIIMLIVSAIIKRLAKE